MTLITSRSNPKIKSIRQLRQHKYRQQTGRFLVEGIHHVGQAVEAAASGQTSTTIDTIFYAPDLLTSDYAHMLVEQAALSGIDCYALSPDVFTSVAEKENPQGILAVAHLSQMMIDEISAQAQPWVVALASPQDPGNIGTILRTIDAVGASGLLLLDDSADPLHPSAVRASMGAIFWYPVVSASFHDFAAWSRRQDYHVYGTSAHGSTDYRRIHDFEKPMVLLLGSEREGLSEQQIAHCQHLLRLPMHGRVSSLNLAVAAGILLYEMLSNRGSGVP
ncbi:MAG: TrmH family RNA methyltransferase [Anaerolineales bacterium]